MSQNDTKNAQQKAILDTVTDLKESSMNEEQALRTKIIELEIQQVALEKQNESLRQQQLLTDIKAQKYAEMYDFAPTAYFTVSTNYEIIEANGVGLQLLGCEIEQIIHRNFIEFLPETSCNIFIAFIASVLESGKIEVGELTLNTPKNEILQVQVSSIYNKNSNQYLLNVLNLNAINKHAELNQTLLASLPHPAMYIRYKDKIILSANKKALDMGVKIGGHCWREFGKSENISDQNKIISAKYPTNVPEVYGIQCTFCDADKCFSTVVPKSNNKDIKALGKTWDTYWIKINDEVYLHYAVDISQQKQELEEREFLISSIENSNNIVVVKDLDLKIVAANQGFLKATGIESLKDVLGKTDAEIFQMPTHSEPVRTYMEDDIRAQCLGEGEFIMKEEPMLQKNGHFKTILTKKYPIFNSNGNLFCTGSVSLDITERKQTEEALQKSEQMLQNIIEHFPGEIFWKDIDSKYCGCNQAFVHSVNCENKNQILNKTDFDVLKNKSVANAYRQEDTLIMESGTECLHKLEMKRHKNGTVSWYDSSKIPLRNLQGNIIGLMGVFIDITDKKMAEVALQKSEEKYRKIIENSHDIIFICNKKGILTYISNACKKTLGYDADEMINQLFKDFVHPDDSQNFQNLINKIFRTNFQYKEEIEYRLKHKNGDWYWFSVRANIITDNNEKIVGIEGITTNIHDRKLAEYKLRESVNNYRFLFANNPQPMWIIDYETEEFLEINRAAIHHYGYSKDEFQTLTLAKIQIRTNKLAPLKHLNNNRKEYHLSLEEKHRVKNGKIICVEITSHAVIYEGKNARHILVNDISKRKQAEENLIKLNESLEDIVKERTSELLKLNSSLKMAEEKFRTVADFTYGWEYWISENGELLYMSPSAEKVTGYALDDFFNEPALIDNIVFENDKESWLTHKNEIYLNAKKKRHSEIIFRIVKKSGDVRWISSLCRSVNINGKYMGMRVSNLNITQKIKAENELLKVTVDVEERERNRFSRELHDGMGPLLSTIKLYFQWLSETDDPEKIQIITQKGNANIESAIQSSREIARGLSTQNLKKFGFVDTITDFCQRLNDTKKISIKFKSNTTEKFDNFVGTTLYRISTELVKNTITYANATLVTMDFSYIKEKKMIYFVYSDNGVGFDMLQSLTENKGLGVMNIQQRIKSMRGKFKIKSEIGKGMRVIIEFPIDEI